MLEAVLAQESVEWSVPSCNVGPPQRRKPPALQLVSELRFMAGLQR